MIQIDNGEDEDKSGEGCVQFSQQASSIEHMEVEKKPMFSNRNTTLTNPYHGSYAGGSGQATPMEKRNVYDTNPYNTSK